VSFVGGNNDARLVGDIEKLIKTKIELEAVEFDEDQPDIRKQGRINDGRRMYHHGEDTGGDNGRTRAPDEAIAAGYRVMTPRAAAVRRAATTARPSGKLPRDPFFDKPYESKAPAKLRPHPHGRPVQSLRHAVFRPTSSTR
jgi:ATP-dependent RNA helicase RhlE